MMNKTVKELRVIAKELGIAKYYSLNKAQLVSAIEEQQLENARLCQDSFYEDEQPYADTELTFETECCVSNELPVELPVEEPVKSNKTVSMFDIKRYAMFSPNPKMKLAKITERQLNLVDSLETNFKVSINVKECNNFYELSMKLSKVYEAILLGKVQYRSEQEIEQRLKGYMITHKPSVKPSVQIKTEEIIKEIAVSSTKEEPTVIETKLQDTTFRTKFVAMMKRMFA